WLMMSLWDALRMNMMISYQELVRTFQRLFVAIYRFPTACDGTLRPAVNWRKVAHRAAIFTLFYHSHATTLH
ncbi:hypothetical protein, partial [Klebsiella pneumoniae]|uniref:hypothetical protein n=1 Tax=Klebsiella pneumoniae TaxID=573 RepID=UPI0039C13A34